MPYSYGQENLRQNTRVSVQREESVLPSHRVVRRQKSRSGRINLQMVIGIGLLVFSLVVVFNMKLLASQQSPVVRFLPSTLMDQINQGSSLPGLSFPVKKILRKVTAFSQG